MKFSILVPAYKQKFFKECIESVLSQTYSNFELIIVDDNSPENLGDVVSLFQDSRIRYFRNKKNCGAVNVVDNWNICLSYATGDYVICMGDDDKLLPNCLDEYLKLINKYPHIGILHGWTEIINENSEAYQLTTHRCEYETVLSLIWHRWFSYFQQFIGDFCFNTKWLRKNGGFYKIPMAWGSDDISAFIGAMKNGIANTQVVVFQYRKNSYTISSTGNSDVKMLAMQQQYEWYKLFLNNIQPTNHVDDLYKRELCNYLSTEFEKKKGWTISRDLHQRPWRLIYWLTCKAKYNLSFRTYLYAIFKSFR